MRQTISSYRSSVAWLKKLMQRFAGRPICCGWGTWGNWLGPMRNILRRNWVQHWDFLLGSVGVVCLLAMFTGCGSSPAPEPSKTTAAKTNVVVATNISVLPTISVFADASTPGVVNPFFPKKAKVAVMVEKIDVPGTVSLTSNWLLLKGTLNAGPNTLALINNASFGVGETRELLDPISGKKIKVKCLKIGVGSAEVQIENNPEPITLKMSQRLLQQLK